MSSCKPNQLSARLKAGQGIPALLRVTADRSGSPLDSSPCLQDKSSGRIPHCPAALARNPKPLAPGKGPLMLDIRLRNLPSEPNGCVCGREQDAGPGGWPRCPGADCKMPSEKAPQAAEGASEGKAGLGLVRLPEACWGQVEHGTASTGRRPGTMWDAHQPSEEADSMGTSACLPFGPALCLLALCPRVDSSHGTCILWLPEGSIQWVPMQVMSEEHIGEIQGSDPSWVCPARGPTPHGCPDLFLLWPLPSPLPSRPGVTSLTQPLLSPTKSGPCQGLLQSQSRP